MSCVVVHLGEPSTEPIAELVKERLGARADAGSWETSKAALLLLVECDPDGTQSDVARKFLKDVKKSDTFTSDSAAIQRRVATLALCKSTCANSAAMLGDGKFTGAKRLQTALTDKHGCTALLPVTCAEIEIQEVDESVMPWVDAVIAALDALAPAET